MFICIGGKNDIAVDSLEYLIQICNGRYEIGVVCDQNEKGINTWQKSLRFFALKYGIPEYQLQDIYEKEQVIFISLEFDRIISPAKFKDARFYNIHFSLLPQYKGMYTSILPILNREKYVGVTLHEIDEGIDTGGIIAQKRFELKDDYTSRDLYLHYISHGTKLFRENIESIIDNDYLVTPQPVAGSTYYSKAALDYSNIVIDLKQTADDIRKQIRAYTFREYQLPTVCGKQILSSRITAIRSTEKPGKILLQNEFGIMLATIDYNIIIYFDRFNELMKACEEGDYPLVVNICQISEHINCSDSRGYTPLMMAVRNNQTKIAEYLIMHGADISARDYNGTSISYTGRN